MERKLSKTQTLQTDIEESVDAIMGQEVEVMALRLSGQLLLGVVRIYSRKAKYLLDDCNEALLKIKMAFRPGVVDMTEDQLVVNKTAITLQTTNLDLDLLLPDVNWGVDLEDRTLQMTGQHQARVDDITLRTADDFHRLDALDPFDIGPVDGIGSQDFNDLDLGINWGDEPQASSEKDDNEEQMSVDGSIGVGRDAASRAESVGSHLLGGKHTLDLDLLSHMSGSRAPSEHPFGADMDVDMTGVDLGDFGIGFDEPMVVEPQAKTPEETRSLSRASSPLSEPPPTPPPEAELPTIEETPTAKPKRKVKEKKQIIDEITEFPEAVNGRGRGVFGPPVAQDVSDIITEQQFLPRSSTVMRLREIRDDPLAHFLPVKHTPNGSFFYAAPPGLSAELASLFMRPLRQNTAQKRQGPAVDKSPNKRARLGEQTEDGNELEQARRAGSLVPSLALGSDIVDRNGVSLDDHIDRGQQFMDDLQLDPKDLEPAAVQLDLDRAPSAAPSELTQLSTPGPDEVFPDENEETYASAECPIATFDSRPSNTQIQTQNETDEVVDEGKGYSKNTVKALGLVRKELELEVGATEKVLSFRQMADKATRRAASSFFFELLVLGTRDCVQLKQLGPFENIEVRAKPKLWTQQNQDALESQELSLA
ncbi:Cohesin subunit rad21 [Leucoagaricus sp. SymC.cos]|nr:Cohesin subunit rad21 [Leucoagaricus sp. SymC.cos]